MQAPTSQTLTWIKSQPGGMAALVDAITRGMDRFTLAGRVVFVKQVN